MTEIVISGAAYFCCSAVVKFPSKSETTKERDIDPRKWTTAYTVGEWPCRPYLPDVVFLALPPWVDEMVRDIQLRREAASA